MPNSTARRPARASKPRHKHARATDRPAAGRCATTRARSHRPPATRGRRPPAAATAADARRDTLRPHRRAATTRPARDRDRRDSGGRDSPDAPRRPSRQRHAAAPRPRLRTGSRTERAATCGTRRARPPEPVSTAAPATGDRRPAATCRRESGTRVPGAPARAARSGDGVRRAAAPVRSPQARSWDGEIAEEPVRKRPSVSFAELGLPTALLPRPGAGRHHRAVPDPVGHAARRARRPRRARPRADRFRQDARLRAGAADPAQRRQGPPEAARAAWSWCRPVSWPCRSRDALTPLAKSLGLWCRTVVGGMSFGKQAEQLRAASTC